METEVKALIDSADKKNDSSPDIFTWLLFAIMVPLLMFIIVIIILSFILNSSSFNPITETLNRPYLSFCWILTSCFFEYYLFMSFFGKKNIEENKKLDIIYTLKKDKKKLRKSITELSKKLIGFDADEKCVVQELKDNVKKLLIIESAIIELESQIKS